MELLSGIFVWIGHAIEAVLNLRGKPPLDLRPRRDRLHFYLHDRSLHARFDALDKRVDELRKRMAVDH